MKEDKCRSHTQKQFGPQNTEKSFLVKYIQQSVLILLKIYPKVYIKFSKYYNRLLLWASGVIIGCNSSIMGKTYIRLKKGAKIVIGNDFVMSSGNGINPISRNLESVIFADSNARIIIGDKHGSFI